MHRPVIRMLSGSLPNEPARQTRSLSFPTRIMKVWSVSASLWKACRWGSSWQQPGASVLSPMDIAEEMEKSLDFLTSSMRDMPEKHRSLRAVYDSSWLLLTDEQQETFSKLSVFRGGFDRQAALQVAGADLPHLSALLGKSLLRRNQAGYFTMHGLLRQFAAEKLARLPELQEDADNRHCRYYVNLLTQRKADFMGPRMLQARDEVRQEMENVRAAVNWASLHWETQSVRKVLIALLCFYTVQGWHEGIQALGDIARLRREALLTRDIPDPSRDPVILSARIHQAFLHSNLGQIEESEAISRECLEGLAAHGSSEELSECLHNLGVNASFRGEYESARAYIEEAILLGRECDHIIWPTYLLWLGHVYFLLGEYEQGLSSLQKCYDVFEQRGTLWGTAFALSKMGLAADGLGEHSQAMRYHQEALSIFERVGNRAGKGYSLSRMSVSACFLEEYPQALQLGQAGYQAFQEIGHRWGICTSLCRLGFAHIGLGDTGSAKDCFRDALQLSRHDRMLPLSLYALTGMACALAQAGEEQTALELFRYVRRHPQTPAPYLEQAVRWMGDLDPASLEDAGAVADAGREMETVDEVAARLLV
jgi:tetratricopeptide (TPR) repeat protein